MSRRASAEAKRHRFAALLRLAAGLAWLVLALTFFRTPLILTMRPTAAGLERLFVGRASGFVLRLVSQPPGGRLWVDGRERGTAPLITNVACEDGQSVRLRVVRDGLAPWQRDVACRQGLTLRVTARLGRER